MARARRTSSLRAWKLVPSSLRRRCRVRGSRPSSAATWRRWASSLTICVGKGFSGGVVPIAGVICSRELLEFWGPNPYRSVSSYAWSNVGCRCTKVAIEETERLLPQALKVGGQIDEVLAASMTKYPDYIVDVERNGMMWSIKLNEDKFNALEAFGGMWENDVNIYPSSQHGPIVKLMPPLITTEEHVAIFAGAWDKTMAAAEGGGHQQWF